MVNSNLKQIALLAAMTTFAIGAEVDKNTGPNLRISNVTGEIFGASVGDMKITFADSVPHSMRADIYKALKEIRNDYNVTNLSIEMIPTPKGTYRLGYGELGYTLYFAAAVRTKEEIVDIVRKALSPGLEAVRKADKLNKWY